MKKRIMFLGVLFVVFLIGCQSEEYSLCPDNFTQVIDLADCPLPVIQCPESCDDGNECTFDRCGPLTEYECIHEETTPCDGNGICEQGEFPWSIDCPKSCDDNNECTEDTFNYEAELCIYENIIPCCGDSTCNSGETYVGCSQDCKQTLDLSVVGYTKRTRFEDSYIKQALGHDMLFLIVEFKIKNIAIDISETINYKTEKGFYYDPFNFRLEDASGKFYDSEYDSDSIDGFLDYVIIPKGDTRGAVLLFVVPLAAEHIRLIAYDRYGNKLDISDVY